MPGGFHPFHAGHAALYQSAVKAFNDADVYVAATNDTKTRPFPFAVKEKLAKLAGVADKHFVQVKSPFQPKEITDHYNPEEDVLIFVRSEKDKNESPKPGGTKKDGTPAYFQPWTGKNVQPFGKQAYIAYLPTVEFGPGITSATEIRNAWPTLNDKRKTAMVMSLYPVAQKNPKLAANVVKMLDMGMGNELSEGSLTEFVPPSSDRDDGGENDRNRRIRKLLEIAIQVAKQKNVDELGMIHAMNMIAGDDFFSVAVEGILPDITDKEYMFVLQSAYKTVKQGLSEGEEITEGPFVQRLGRPNKVNIYVRHTTGKPSLLIATDIPYSIYDKFIAKAMQKYPQFKQTDFSFKSLDKIDEFVTPDGGDDREPDEEILRQLAAQWWNGTEQQMAKAQRTLELMGWDIGQDESGDEDAGVFVIRVGDENGDSYIAFPHSALSLNDINEDYLDEN